MQKLRAALFVLLSVGVVSLNPSVTFRLEAPLPRERHKVRTVPIPPWRARPHAAALKVSDRIMGREATIHRRRSETRY